MTTDYKYKMTTDYKYKKLVEDLDNKPLDESQLSPKLNYISKEEYYERSDNHENDKLSKMLIRDLSTKIYNIRRIKRTITIDTYTKG